jgi:uncharacterized membrane protein YhaH (DUF805 family)
MPPVKPIKLEDILPHLWISGRSSRAEWWRVHIVCAVLAVMFEHVMTTQLAPRNGVMPPITLLWPLASLALAWISVAGVVRRFHDRGKSGWWALLYFLPFIGWLWILIECGFLPGKPAAQVPAFTPPPAPAKPAPASRSTVRLQTAPRAGTVQRRDEGTWDSKRTMALANNALRLVIAAVAAFLLYRFATDPGTSGVFSSEIQRPQSPSAN